MDRTQELEDQVRHLSRSVEEMRRRMALMEGDLARPGTQNDGSPSSRRNFLRLGAGAALGALGLAAGRILPAAAADGANVVTGATVTAESPTIISGDGLNGAPTPVFAAEANGFSLAAQTAAGTFAGPLQGLGTQGLTGVSAVAVDGVDGWAEGDKAFGVYGLTDSGVGVAGESSTGIGLYSRGSGRILQDPQPAGAPTFAANDFEIVRDANGLMWISVPGGTWKQVGTTDLGMHIFPNPRRVWDGFIQPQAPGIYGPVDATTQISTSGGPGGPSGVPAGAQAAWCAVLSYSAGVMTVFPDGTADTLIGNWASTTNGVLNILYMFVPLSAAGKFKFHAYFTGKKFFDVWGYLM